MQEIRNIAIIAHVDHGKTTLVDKIIHYSKLFRENQVFDDLILDNNDQERERGITITSKNVSIRYKGVKINIIDTPGHADFGGEVERVLKMADGVILLVDAFEGPMPQTRFVLGKAIGLGLKPVVIVNKVDKENCRPDEVYESVFDLMFNLGASEDQLDFVTLYGSSKQGWMSYDYKKPTDNIEALLETIIKVIPPAPVLEGPLQMQITSIDFSTYTGRMAIGRVFRGTIKEGQHVVLCQADGSFKKNKIKELQVFEGLARVKVPEAFCGDICLIIGIDEFEIGDTVADAENPEALTRIAVDEPTMSMLFTINNSPFYGKEGKYVTSRHIRDRLYKETEKNLALKVHNTESEDKFLVYG
ncbi:MAG: GTP-binding protein, partial [Opitutaceae bacterium]|nr:GTP-binding protein [Cytophagales bacterium]